MELKQIVSQNVKAARKIKSDLIGKRYTQKMLESDTGLSQSYISEIESAESLPSSRAAYLIADACGVSVDFIMGREKKEDQTVVSNVNSDNVCPPDLVYLPVVGNIAAGKPILATENIQQYIPYPAEYDVNHHFVLRVQGDSMIDAGIDNGDLVVVRQQPEAENGQIVAVRLKDDGVTLKKFYRLENKVILKPCNENYSPIELTEDLSVIGIAVSITKKLA